MTNHRPNSTQLTPEKLRACVPYECSRGSYLQVPFCSVFETSLDNTGGTAFLQVPGNEQGAPAKNDFLVYSLSALVTAPYTYLRVQWPDGLYLSNVPVDIWAMMRTGRNGRLLGRSKFIEAGQVIRMELGTQQTAVVGVKIHFEGALLIKK